MQTRDGTTPDELEKVPGRQDAQLLAPDHTADFIFWASICGSNILNSFTKRCHRSLCKWPQIAAYHTTPLTSFSSIFMDQGQSYMCERPPVLFEKVPVVHWMHVVAPGKVAMPRHHGVIRTVFKLYNPTWNLKDWNAQPKTNIPVLLPYVPVAHREQLKVPIQQSRHLHGLFEASVLYIGRVRSLTCSTCVSPNSTPRTCFWSCSSKLDSKLLKIMKLQAAVYRHALL